MTVISQGSGASRGAGGRLRRLRVATYGSGLGVLVVGVGLLLIGIGWNGVAGGGGEINGVPNLNAQLPWLVSGGLLGLAFVVFGSAIVVAHNARVDRARLEAKLDEMTAALERSTAVAHASPAAVHAPEPRAPRVVEASEDVRIVPAPAAAKSAAPRKATAKKVAAKRATTSPRR